MDVDSDDEAGKELKVKELAEKILTDPYDFAAYAEIITLHRYSGDLDETRAYRQQVQSLYCLPEEMWTEWLKDELKLGGEVDHIVTLFETALGDYHY